jgi:hypothetical protein
MRMTTMRGTTNTTGWTPWPRRGNSPGVIPLDRGANVAGSTTVPRARGSRPRGSCGNGRRRRAPEVTGVGLPRGDGGIPTLGDSGVATATPSAQHGRDGGDREEALPYDNGVRP